jgi:hypothetical protein
MQIPGIFLPSATVTIRNKLKSVLDYIVQIIIQLHLALFIMGRTILDLVEFTRQTAIHLLLWGHLLQCPLIRTDSAISADNNP